MLAKATAAARSERIGNAGAVQVQQEALVYTLKRQLAKSQRSAAHWKSKATLLELTQTTKEQQAIIKAAADRSPRTLERLIDQEGSKLAPVRAASVGHNNAKQSSLLTM